MTVAQDILDFGISNSKEHEALFKRALLPPWGPNNVLAEKGAGRHHAATAANSAVPIKVSPAVAEVAWNMWNDADRANELGHMLLPYRNVFLEFSVPQYGANVGLLVLGNDDLTSGDFYCAIGGRSYAFLGKCSFRFDGEMVWRMARDFPREMSAATGKVISHYFLAVISLLQTEGATATRVVNFDEKQQRKRMKRGRMPLLSIQEVSWHWTNGGHNDVESAYDGENAAERRWHLVKSHWRWLVKRQERPRKVLVRSHPRGNANRGVAFPTHVVDSIPRRVA